jgi:hypothetical protein
MEGGFSNPPWDDATEFVRAAKLLKHSSTRITKGFETIEIDLNRKVRTKEMRFAEMGLEPAPFA